MSRDQPEIHHPPPVMPVEHPDRSPGYWPDYPEDRHYPPWWRLPHRQPGLRFPQPPGGEDWDDGLWRA